MTEKPAEDSTENPVIKPSEKVPIEQTTKKGKKCSSHAPIKDKSLKGGKKSGKFRYFKNIKDIKACTAKCCSLDKACDVAYMEEGKCYTLSCFKKGLCMSVDKQPQDQSPVIVYMDHFINKAEETEAVENDQGIGKYDIIVSSVSSSHP